MMEVCRCVYLLGERTPIVTWVLGRLEMCGSKAVPSSPAPRRRILVISPVGVVDVMMSVVWM